MMSVRLAARLSLFALVAVVVAVRAPRALESRRQDSLIQTTVQSRPDQVVARIGHPLRPYVRAMAADLAEHGMAPARARRLAPYIISLAAHFEISPSLVFGVMLTENRGFVSTATSSAGAVGLMQLMPGTHARFARTCGPDRTNDIANVCAGIHVLEENMRRTGDLHKALLRYNGCVRGTRTPNCFSYPDVVLRNAATGRWQCPSGRPLYCVSQRLSISSPARG